MEEIAATFRDAGLPDQFHLGAAALYKRMVRFKDQIGSVKFHDVISEINKKSIGAG
jgi:hypothetical protein